MLSLRDLGQGINYNAYGDSEADLLIPPARCTAPSSRMPIRSTSWPAIPTPTC